MTNSQGSGSNRPRLLIEEWLPIAKLSAEAVRERTISLAGNVLPATTYLHV